LSDEVLEEQDIKKATELNRDDIKILLHKLIEELK
jgi:hypothetical protein